MNADDVIRALDLSPHPEGGWYRETWRAEATEGKRAAGTAIYYLLDRGQRSHWHKVDAAEIWHWYAGGPLELSLSPDGTGQTDHLLGPGIGRDQAPQIIIPAGCWQSARPLDGFTLVGCTVSPAFEFEGFEMAPPGWNPKDTR